MLGTPLHKILEEREKSNIASKRFRTNENANIPVPNKSRSLLDRTFDALSVTTYPIMGALKGLISDEETVLGGFGKGLLAANPFGKGYEEGENTFSDVLEAGGWKPESTGGKIAKGVVGFTGDVLLDPLTYLSGGLTALGKGTGKAAGKKVAKEVIEEAAEQTMKRAMREGLIEAAEKGTKEYAEQLAKHTARFQKHADKVAGTGHIGKDLKFGLSEGPIPFHKIPKSKTYQKVANSEVGKTISKFVGQEWMEPVRKAGKAMTKTYTISDAENLRLIGDKTVAPIYFKIRDTLMGSKHMDKFSDTASLYKVLEKDPMATFRFMELRHYTKGIKGNEAAKMRAMQDMLRRMEVDLSPSAQQSLRKLMENDTIWKHTGKLLDTEMGRKLIDNAKKMSDDAQKSLDDIQAQIKEKTAKLKAGGKEVSEEQIEKITKEVREASVAKPEKTVSIDEVVKPEVDIDALNKEIDEMTKKVEKFRPKSKEFTAKYEAELKALLEKKAKATGTSVQTTQLENAVKSSKGTVKARQFEGIDLEGLKGKDVFTDADLKEFDKFAKSVPGADRGRRRAIMLDEVLFDGKKVIHPTTSRSTIDNLIANATEDGVVNKAKLISSIEKKPHLYNGESLVGKVTMARTGQGHVTPMRRKMAELAKNSEYNESTWRMLYNAMNDKPSNYTKKEAIDMLKKSGINKENQKLAMELANDLNYRKMISTQDKAAWRASGMDPEEWSNQILKQMETNKIHADSVADEFGVDNIKKAEAERRHGKPEERISKKERLANLEAKHKGIIKNGEAVIKRQEDLLKKIQTEQKAGRHAGNYMEEFNKNIENVKKAREDVRKSKWYLENRHGKTDISYKDSKAKVKEQLKAKNATPKETEEVAKIVEQKGSATSIDKELEALRLKEKEAYDELAKINANLESEEAMEAYLRTFDPEAFGASDTNLAKLDLGSEGDRIKYWAEKFRKTLRKMGEKEVEIGKLSQKQLNKFYDKYLPHIATDDFKAVLAELADDVDANHITDLPGFGQEFSVHKLSRGAVAETPLEKILKKQGINLKDMSTIDEWNEALRPLLKGKNAFSDNISDIMLTRMMNHNKVMYDNQVMNSMMKVFGDDIGDTLKEGHKAYANIGIVQSEIESITKKKMKEIAKRTKKKLSGEEMDAIRNSIKQGMADDLGIDVKQLDKTATPMLEIPLENAKKLKGYKNLQIKSMHSSFPDKINAARLVQIERDSSSMLKLFDKFTHLYKVGVTAPLPSFHVGNKIGNLFSTWLSTGADMFDKDLGRVMKEVKAAFKAKKPITSSTQLPIKGTKKFLHLSDEIIAMEGLGTIDKGMFAAEIGADGSNGLLKGLGVKGKYDPTDAKNFIGTKVGSYIENTERVKQFLIHRMNGKSQEEAAELVNKFLFDYGDLTHFEQRVMKRAIPFYTWSRKNIPLQIEQLLDQPSKYKGVAHFMNGIKKMENKEDRMDPSYSSEFLDDYIQTPFGTRNARGDREPIVFNPRLPVQDLNRMPTSLKKIISQANPVFKVPLELATNKNTYFDSKIVKGKDTAVEDLIEYLAKQQGLSSVAHGALTKDDDDLLTHLLSTMGIRVSSYDYEKAKKYRKGR